MKAQTARGADFESGNLVQRAKAMIPLLVPLFLNAVKRADELAMAMEARCYHGRRKSNQIKSVAVYQTRLCGCCFMHWNGGRCVYKQIYLMEEICVI